MWHLKGHSICVHNLDIAADFFGKLISLGKSQKSGDNSLIFSSERSYFQIVQPSPDLVLQGSDILAPTAHRHVAIEIADLEKYYFNAIGKPEKFKIIARDRSYHGVTVASASLTGLAPNHTHFDLPIDALGIYWQSPRDVAFVSLSVHR